MKHTFVLIDALMKLIQWVPPVLNNEDDLNKAKAALDKIIKYEWQLNKLITAHKTKENLEKLQQVHIDSIDNWAKQVSDLFSSLNELMKVLYEDVRKLQGIIDKGYTWSDHSRRNTGVDTPLDEDRRNAWASRISDMSMGIVMAGFYDIENQMKEFRKIEILEIEHLLKLIGKDHTINLFQSEHNHMSEEEKTKIITVIMKIKYIGNLLE